MSLKHLKNEKVNLIKQSIFFREKHSSKNVAGFIQNDAMQIIVSGIKIFMINHI